MSIELNIYWNISTICNHCDCSVVKIFDITYDNIVDALSLSCTLNNNKQSQHPMSQPIILPETSELKKKIMYFDIRIFTQSYSKYIDIDKIENDVDLSCALRAMQFDHIRKIEIKSKINFVPIKVILNNVSQIYVFDPNTKIEKAMAIIKNNYKIIDAPHDGTCNELRFLFDNDHFLYIVATQLINSICLY